MVFFGRFLMNLCDLSIFRFPDNIALIGGVIVFFTIWFTPNDEKYSFDKFLFTHLMVVLTFLIRNLAVMLTRQ